MWGFRDAYIWCMTNRTFAPSGGSNGINPYKLANIYEHMCPFLFFLDVDFFPSHAVTHFTVMSYRAILTNFFSFGAISDIMWSSLKAVLMVCHFFSSIWLQQRDLWECILGLHWLASGMTGHIPNGQSSLAYIKRWTTPVRKNLMLTAQIFAESSFAGFLHTFLSLLVQISQYIFTCFLCPHLTVLKLSGCCYVLLISPK